MKRSALLIALMCLRPVLAEDLKLKDGTVYKDFSVVKQEADALKIEHKDGVAKVEMELLPDDVKKRYEWDPSKIKTVRDAAAKAKAVKAAEAAAAKEAEAAKVKGEAEAEAWLKRRIESTKADAREAGPARVWLVGAQRETVDTAFGTKPGTSYIVAVENTGIKPLTGTLRGTVFLRATGDEPRECKLSVPAKETKLIFVESIIGPGENTAVLVDLLNSTGAKVGSAEMAAGRDLMDFVKADREK